MKKLAFLAMGFICSAIAFADDVIVFANGTAINGKVVEVATEEVKYRRSDNPDGPLYTAKRSELFSIQYENGSVDTFGAPTSKGGILSASIPVGKEYFDWNDDIDYLNVCKELTLSDYKKIVLLPFDYSTVVYPDKRDNRYPALMNALQEFPKIVRKELSKKLKDVTVVVADDNTPLDDSETLYLSVGIDMLDMGSRAERLWVGFGAGAQRMRILVAMQEGGGNYVWSFKHERHSISGKSYEVCLTNEMENFAKDIVCVIKKKM